MGGEVGSTTPRGALARSSSGVWWKLGDTAADASEVERRLRAIADEEAGIRARIQKRCDAAPTVRRRIAVASVSLETAALLWAATRRRSLKKKKLHYLLLPALAIPAMATLALAAFARFRRTCMDSK